MENPDGERALIAAIIARAIEDARSHRYPKPPAIATKILKQCNRKIKIIATTIYNICSKSEHTSHILIVLDTLIKTLAKLVKKRRSYYNELRAYEARCFFDAKNKVFFGYCAMLDMDERYFAEKAAKYFRNYDRRIIA